MSNQHVDNLIKLHNILHKGYPTDKGIIRKDKPNDNGASCTYKGFRLSTLNTKKYPEHQILGLPQVWKEVRVAESQGHKMQVTWIINPGQNTGLAGKIVTIQKGNKVNTCIYMFGSNREETKLSEKNYIEEPIKPYPTEVGVHFVEGDLFKSPSNTIVATVNTGGVMGLGLSKEVRVKYPEVVEAYTNACKNGSLQVGKVLYTKGHDEKNIILFPTKQDWRFPSSLEWIEGGLQTIARTYNSYGVKELSIPALGCHLGGLTWEKEDRHGVKHIMLKYLSLLNIPVYIHYEYGGLDLGLDTIQPTVKVVQAAAADITDDDIPF